MHFLRTGLFAAMMFCLSAWHFSAPAAPVLHGADGLKHAGAVYFYAQPGTLNVTLWKHDLSGDPASRALTAVLAGPDGTIHQRLQLTAPAGEAGRRVEATLQANVARAGIYTLLLSANSDQYLNSQVIGFSTNAAQYMISSGAGHTDTARQEPIILDGAQKPFGIFFKPAPGAFDIKISALPGDAKIIEMYDATGQSVRTFNVAEGKVEASFAATDGVREGIWELRLPSQKGNVLIEGVNYGWAKTQKPLPVWATSREHYFDLSQMHWLLSPRRFARKAQPGEKGAVSFTLFNNSATPMPVELRLDAPPQTGKMSVSVSRLELAPGARKSVAVQYALPASLPDGKYDFTLIARNASSNLQAFALGELRVSRAPQKKAAMDLPIQLQLFEHDQFQFAYEPEYSRFNQFYFDSANRPWQVTRLGLQTLIGDQWKTVTLPAPADGSAEIVRYITSTIGTDNAGHAYTIVERGGKTYLLRADATTLQGQLAELPAGGKYTIETFMGGKSSLYPPAVLRYVVQKDKAQITFWSRVHHLQAFIPKIADGKLQIGPPILISDNCVGFSDHSGITNPVAADGDKLHFIWGETSDPKKNDPGVPTYTSTYDRKTGALSKPILLAYSPPVNDIHNMSTILVDSSGQRHAIIGSHGQPFQYLRADAGSDTWSTPKEVTQMNPTYIGAVLDENDDLHMFFRQWRREAQFTGAELGYQQMKKGGEWKPQKAFAIAALPGYSVFYHRLTTDRTGRLYLSFEYWSTWSPYRESYPDAAKRPLYFTSADHGQSWQIVTTAELSTGIAQTK
jgi:hypothetical protein